MRFYFPNKPIRVFDPTKISGSIRDVDGWIVQPKWNGKRAMVYCDPLGQVKVFSREGRPWPQEKWEWLSKLPLPKPWFLDGELLRDGRLYVWDYALLGGEPFFTGPYEDRLRTLQSMLPQPWCRDSQRLEVVETLPAAYYEELLRRQADLMLEGIVWKLRVATNLWGPYKTTEVATQFKYRFR